MMFLCEINNNILISGALFLGGYKYEYGNCDLYQEINILWVVINIWWWC